MATSVSDEVRALAGLDLEQLRNQWRQRFGAPPKFRSADLLRRNLAWRIQAAAFGGLDPSVAAVLRSGAGNRREQLAFGMRLGREWRGVRHEIEVTEGGIRYRGEIFESLSQVARHITGVRWNGPRFFGLRQPDAQP